MSGRRPHARLHHTGRVDRRLPVGGPWIARALVFTFTTLRLAGLLPAAPAEEPAPLHFSFSSQAFVEVNENDARAALKVWARAVGAELGVAVDPAMEIFAGTGDIRDALLSRRTDAVTMTTAEFWALRGEVPLGPILLARTRGVITEEYLLLVRRDDPAVRLADLRGRSLTLLTGARAALAPAWMETILLEEKLGPPGAFWGKTSQASKLSRVILPVFFRQVDACIVTRAGFHTMCELNPQVARQLRVMAESPALVPTVFSFHRGLISPYRDNLIAGIGHFADSPAGRQTLALFQCDHLEAHPLSDLDATCAFLDRHQRLLAEAVTVTAPEIGPVGVAQMAAGERRR